MTSRFRRFFLSAHALALLLALPIMLSACGQENEGTLRLSVIGSPDAVSENLAALSPAGRLLRAASTEGLVSFDAQGRVVPALADRWIVTDDGESYIFRLRDGKWPDGSPITAETARLQLKRALAALRGTPLANDLAEVAEIRAMAGRVIEIRLASPVPDLLTLLAQPELALTPKGRGTGPMDLQKEGQVLNLSLIPPERRGLPAEPDFATRARTLRVRLETAQAAVDRFNAGEIDLVLGGKLDSLPLAGASGLLRGNVQLDPVIGLFGLSVQNSDGFLADPQNREALAMTVDRDALTGAFNIRGWQPTSRLVSPDVDDDLGTAGERWTDMTLEQRRAAASARVARWKESGQPLPPLRLALPEGPGSRLVLNRLVADFAAIGVQLRAVPETAVADLRLVDTVARYGRATWFLNQLSCAATPVCSAEGDARVANARIAMDPQQRARLLAEAELAITAANGFIPFARPLRWSLVRSSVIGFAPNPWGWHPLPPLALLPR